MTIRTSQTIIGSIQQNQRDKTRSNCGNVLRSSVVGDEFWVVEKLSVFSQPTTHNGQYRDISLLILGPDSYFGGGAIGDSAPTSTNDAQ